MVSLDQLLPGSVTERRLPGGGTDDVGEQDRGEHRVEIDGRLGAHELPDHLGDLGGIQRRLAAGHDLQCRLGHDRSEVLRLAHRLLVILVCEQQRRDADGTEDVTDVGLVPDASQLASDVGSRRVPAQETDDRLVVVGDVMSAGGLGLDERPAVRAVPHCSNDRWSSSTYSGFTPQG